MKARTKKTFFKITVAVIAVLMIATFFLGTAIHTKVQAAQRPRTLGAEYSSARGMATIEMTTGRLLYAKNAYSTMPMASTTKIVTAITVLEHVKDIDEVVTVNPKAIGVEGTSIYLQRGEQLTVRELLYGLMLRSGNDASVALALHISESVEEFSQLMNQLATKAGAQSSSFKNPHGLDEEGHVTTAYDLALITAYAMKNQIFAEIVATKEKRISGVEYPRVMQNKNRLLRSNSDVIGVKTGFTSKAGRCFVGALEDNGMTVICVVLNCGPMFPESEHLMERATEEYYMHKVLPKETVIRPTIESTKSLVGMVTQDWSFPIKPSEIDKIEIKINPKDICVFFDGKFVHAQPYTLVNG